MKKWRFKNFNQHGFDHVFLAVGFVVLVGLVGSIYLLLNHASGTYNEYHIGGSNYCLNNEGDTTSSGGYVVIWGCKTTDQASQWTRNGSLIQSAAGDVCLDDWGQSKVNGGGNWVRLYTCNSSDRAQQWSAYGNNQFRNAASGLCLDDWRGYYSQGNEVDQYTCKTSGATNQEWDPQSVGSTSSGGGGNVGTNPPVSQCPQVVKSGVSFSTSTPQGSYTNCIEAVQNMVNGVRAYAVYNNQKYPTGPAPQELCTGMIGPIDGVYGNDTATSVKCAQQYLSSLLTADGVVGPETLAALCGTAEREVYSNSLLLGYLNGFSAAGYNSTKAMFGTSTGSINCPYPYGGAPAL